jgi:hypothetical protein
VSSYRRSLLPFAIVALFAAGYFDSLGLASRPTADTATPKENAVAATLVLRAEDARLFPPSGGQEFHRKFRIRNNHTQAMILKEVAKSCGCISHGGNGLQIRPEEERDVILTSRIGPGDHKRLVAVFDTGLPEQPQVALEWLVVTYERTIFEPAELRDFEVPFGGRKEFPLRVVTRQPASEPQGRVSVATSPPPCCRSRSSPATKRPPTVSELRPSNA